MRYILILLVCLISVKGICQSEREPLFKSFDGTMIHYDVKGEGRPVVLLHGFISNSNSWKNSKLVSALVTAGFKVVTLDLRGNGLSDKPHEVSAYENNAEIKDVMALMKFLGFKKYDVIGYSRGAILVARMLTLDKNIRTAVLGGVGVDFTNPQWERRKMFEEAFSGKAHLHPETQGAVAYAKSVKADTLVLGILQKVQPSTSKEALEKVKKPVLVIAGNEDIDNGQPADLAKLIPNAVFKTVPGNHNNASHSAEFAEAIISFLKTH
jgi:pimeloyl-ACP methyl ester carboxylesterase